MHGEAFNEGPRQAAYLMGGTGKVHFPVTAKVEEVQAFFDQGIGQLHGFWYFEAERSFRQAAMLDPDCAMAYWGMAMANTNNAKRARGFIQEAAKRKSTISDREKAWIEASEDYLKEDSRDGKARRNEFIRRLEDLIHDYPDDLEPKAFLAWFLWDSKGDLPISSYETVDSLLDEIFLVEPMHPAHHYRIHLWDPRKPKRALGSAAVCGQTAPRVAHMWHMAGHIFWDVERYADSAWQQEASARVDHAHMMQDRVMPYQIHNYAHNNEWMVRSLSHVGRVHDGIDTAVNQLSLPRHPKRNNLDNGGTSANFGFVRLLELLTRFEMWEEIVALSREGVIETVADRELNVKRTRALGSALAATGDRQGAREQLDALARIVDELRGERSKAGTEAEEKAKMENKPEADVKKARTDAEKNFDGRIKQARMAAAEVRGRMAVRAGNLNWALCEFDVASNTPDEQLALVHSAAGRHARAEELARGAVRSGKSQVLPLAVLVEVLYAAGKADEARHALEQLRPLSASIDVDVAPFRRLARIAQELGFASDWRVPKAVAADAGIRPSLDSLGPFRWSPTPAAEWNLPDANGQIVSLAEYRGKPVIVLFYLGAGCVHCVEQLTRFAPLADRFAQQEIQLVAVSTEPVDQLHLSVEAASKGMGSFPIRLVSDSSLDAFRAYRCYDDFERIPLHGTFLIDASGHVVWQDIGFEPFSDAEFMLKESERLLHPATRRGSN
jgi:peroxiredoxin